MIFEAYESVNRTLDVLLRKNANGGILMDSSPSVRVKPKYTILGDLKEEASPKLDIVGLAITAEP
jgi:hypothetical protein